MAKAKNPTCLSRAFNIDPKRLSDLGVLDITLAIDTKLFIDPMLIEASRHPEFCEDGVRLYRDFFETIIKLLNASKNESDVAWKAAYRRIRSKEITGTCLGYGAGSIHGSAIGHELAMKILRVASQIINLGVNDPDIFAALALFESQIGPDRISDLTAKIILPAIGRFNHRILSKLNVTGELFTFGEYQYHFLKNPFESKKTPVLLLPKDILRNLPIAMDWDDVAYAASHNEELRDRVNKHIASIWASKTKRDKNELKREALSSSSAFNALLQAMHEVKKHPYDSTSDPDGFIVWAINAEQYAKKFPITITRQNINNLDDALSVVRIIIKQFRHLIEHCGLSKELYKVDGEPRHESTAQRLFFATAFAYCEANNLDISPEIDTGNGKIDFKFSRGHKEKVLVEIKLSKNSSVVTGYENQIEDYKRSQNTTKAIYLVIDVGQMGSKDKRLVAIRNDALKRGDPLSDLEFIDGILHPSASKNKSRSTKP
nr:hypothetical protein [uncultured Holophaga sp.]